MRVRQLVLSSMLLLLVVLAASACGGGGKQSPRDAYASKLDSACNDMRKQIEGLGQPNDTPMAKIYPGTVKIGHTFVKQIRQLEAPPAEKANAGLLIKQFGYYFDGLALGYAVLVKRKNQQGFIQTVGGAEANLKLAEGYARKLGAEACTRRPFR
jgi:hypothetical protein